MKVQLYNINAESVGEISLPKEIFEAKISDKLIAQSVRVYLANQRSSHAKTKNRSEVAGSRKKVWAQKGTGRARHGNRTAPIFVGGGVTHGPTGEQNFSLKMPKRMRQVALHSILSKLALANKIIVIDKINEITPKTKEAIKLITGLRSKNEVLSKSRKVGIITTKTLSNVKRSFGNLKNTNLLSLKSINVYTLSNQNFLIFSKKAVQSLK